MASISVRSFRPDDRLVWSPLWEAYLTFYRSSLPQEVTDETWRRFHDDSEPIYGLLAERDDVCLGFAHYLFHRSTWSMGSYCYLEDLFVTAEARGQGVATALIEAVYGRAKVKGANRLYWLTHESNEAARSLYDKVASRAGFIEYRRTI